MPSRADIENVARKLLAQRNLSLVSCETLQSLWAGYGHICHVVAAPTGGEGGAQQTSLILKYITPPRREQQQQPTDDSRAPDEGHIRKLLSYQVELSFYTRLAPQLPATVAVAECVASWTTGRETAMLLTDLRAPFPVAAGRRALLTEPQVLAALDWLAGFHGHWWAPRGSAVLLDEDRRAALVRPPLEHVARQHGGGGGLDGSGQQQHVDGVWLNGGYTYLATRRAEYGALMRDADSEWAPALCRPLPERGDSPLSVAELVARVLSDGGGVDEYRTLIHGDVKSENLFASAEGEGEGDTCSVAFFDFQYVGLGLGACDLAKLFTCSVPRSMLLPGRAGKLEMGEGEERLLRFYLERLRRVAGREYEWDVLVRHWETALVDWLRFQASWGFWGNTEFLEARVRSILDDKGWAEWLRAAVD